MSFPIQTSCPRCRAAFVVRESQVGTQVTCPDCLEEFLVEATESAKKPPPTPHDPIDLDFNQLQPQVSGDTRKDSLPGDDDLDITPEPASDIPYEPQREPESRYDFTAVCPLCGTRQDTTSEQIGATLKCPDCHFSFTVPEPPRAARRTHVDLPAANDGDLQLSEPVPSTLRSKISQDWLGAAKHDLDKQAARSITPQHVAHETLRKATEEFDQTAEDQPKFPRHPFRSGLLAFLSSPTTIARWLITAVALEIELGAVEMAIRSALAGGIGQIFALFVGLVAFVCGLLLFCFISTSLLLVTQHSSQGRDQITGWPGVNVTEWMFEAWPIVAVLFLTLAPGILLGQVISTIADDASWMSWIGVSVGVVSMTLLFPVLMLSWMENSAPYSKPIWRSVRICQRVWLSFWLHSGSLVLGMGVLVKWRLRSGSGLTGLMLDFGLLLGLLVYFRLLGRLSWACDEVLSRLEEGRTATTADR